MAHHLYVLQSLTLGLLEPRMRMPLDPCSQVGAFGCTGWRHLELGLKSVIVTTPQIMTPRSSGNSCRPCARLPLSQKESPSVLA